MTRDCAFLEVGSRAGGAEIPLLWREVHSYDLMRSGFLIQLGLLDKALDSPADPADDEIGGWLLFPSPARRPRRITEVTSVVGQVPGPYAEALLSPGEVLPDADSYYEHVGGRFRFRGPSSAAVEDAIRATISRFRIQAEPATTATPVGPGSRRWRLRSRRPTTGIPHSLPA